MATHQRGLWIGLLLLIFIGTTGRAQVDPENRQLFQLGYNAQLVGKAPLSGYAFYYLNRPNFSQSNITLRLALAPVYLDSELGVEQLLGPNTDLGIGISGGGFADTYDEIRRGKWWREESYEGHGGEVSASVYHLFNPGQMIPLNMVLRVAPHYSNFNRTSDTEDTFVLPENGMQYYFRAGLRYGGREPLLRPRLAMEVSAWYEAQLRSNRGSYGFNNDRQLNHVTHNVWGRALLDYTIEDWEHFFEINITGGTSWQADRLSAYRIGGQLPLASEFSLMLPGYYFREISAQSFVNLGGSYSMAIDSRNRWHWTFTASTAWVDYLEGLELPDPWQTGIGSGIAYRSPNSVWQIMAIWGYGFNAIRPDGHRGQSIGLLMQFDLERRMNPNIESTVNPDISRGLLKMFRK